MQTQIIPVTAPQGAPKVAGTAGAASAPPQAGVATTGGAASVFAMLLAAQGRSLVAQSAPQAGPAAAGQSAQAGNAENTGSEDDAAAAGASPDLLAAMTPQAAAQGTVTNLTLDVPETAGAAFDIDPDGLLDDSGADATAGDAVLAATAGKTDKAASGPQQAQGQPASQAQPATTAAVPPGATQIATQTGSSPAVEQSLAPTPQPTADAASARPAPLTFDAALAGTGTAAGTPAGTQVQTAQAASAPVTHHAQATAHPAAQQVAVNLTRAAREGMDRIEIQLNPAELGRVDVKLEVGHDGRVTAVISADRAETLDMLRRDVQQFEKAIANAGLDASRDSFTFAERRDREARPGLAGTDGATGETPVEDAAAPRDIYAGGRRIALDRLGIDMKV